MAPGQYQSPPNKKPLLLRVPDATQKKGVPNLLPEACKFVRPQPQAPKIRSTSPKVLEITDVGDAG